MVEINVKHYKYGCTFFYFKLFNVHNFLLASKNCHAVSFVQFFNRNFK